MNIKKLFATLAGVSLFAQTVVPFGALAATYSAELQDAYDWAYGKGVTTMSSIDNANMYGAITRAEMAKMLSVYATEVLGYEADASKACNFTDIDSVKGDLHDYIIKSCQLGLMGQGITAFRPYDTISRAEFGTALSRTLWGDKYEGGTPYYANHLNALKAAGIMNQISNAESMKEVRGYVMLMLMRSEGDNASSKADCEDPAIALACSLESDSCPAECKGAAEEETNDNGKVKAGDLEVSASSSSSKVLANGTSDMDTLTFKSSEEVEITKVIIERYGYSTNDDVAEVWLENEDGTIIAEPRSLDSKGQAKLSIKKDYRIIDGTYNATIVLSAKGSAGKTIGFKVVDVDSTAKNLNIDNYKPNQYDMMEYSGANVTITARGTTKDYNFEAGELYEIAKFKVKAPTDSAILVKGFTLSEVNATANNVDIKKYLDNAEVTVAGEKVSASYEVNKDDQLVISFKKDVEVAAKANVEIAVKASLSEDFDDYGYLLNLNIAKSADFNAIDSKTESRVTIGDLANTWPTYNFKGGKVKLTNTRLGNVDGAQNSDDVVVAEGTITVPEDIKGTLVVEVKGSTASAGAANAIQAMRVAIAGDEYEGKLTLTGAATSPITGYDTAEWTFSNVEIVDGGKIQFRVDTRDVDWYSNQKITFSFKTGFNTFNYVEAKKPVEIAGSMSFSTLTIQPARASLTNSATKAVEFRNNESNRKVVFDGEYTAKKGAIKLNEFLISGSLASISAVNTGTVTFYLSIDGDEVADAQIDTTNTGGSTFSNVEIAAGKTVKVVLEAEVDAKSGTGSLGTYKLTLKGEDENGNNAGEASRNTVELKVVEKGSITVNSSSSEKKTVLRKTTNATLAEFVVKPSNGASEVDLEEIIFQLSGANAPSSDDITVSIDGTTEDYTNATAAPKGTNIIYQPTVTLGSEGAKIKVELNTEVTGIVELTGLYINGKKQSVTFAKRFENVIVRLVKQEDVGSVTKFTVEVDGDDDITVSNLKIGTGAGATATIPAIDGEFNDGDTFEIAGNDKAAQMIESIRYTTSDTANPTVDILKSEYNDFFKIGDTYARILKA